MNLRIFVALGISLCVAVTASAVLIDSGDGTANTAPYPMSVLEHVAVRGGLSAVYLGDGAVLTANHVGAGDVWIGGTLYPWVPGSDVRLTNGDGSPADLLLFAIEPRPALPTLEIATVRPPYLNLLVVAGNGRNRGVPITWDPNGSNPPGPTGGYAWGSGTALRWGTNRVEVFPSGRILGTDAFGSLFDAENDPFEAQAVTGDSGGAVFSWNPPVYRLAGVIIGISRYANQPLDATLYGQTSYYADLADYRDEILDLIAMPEPSGGLGPGVLLLAALSAAQRRRRQTLLRRCAIALLNVP